MKINYLLIIIVLALGCKENANVESSPAEEDNAKQIEKKAETTNSDLKQNGNYSSLFDSPDCKIITVEEISSTLGVSFIDMNQQGFCSFKSEISKNKTWYLSILRDDVGKNSVQREIETFKSDETGMLEVRVSDTGDTYLCNQHLNGYLSIYNPNYDGSVLIRYGSVGESRAFTKEERLEHKNLAFKLANTILKKHQK